MVDGLKVDHLRLVMGTSMGCKHAWMWAEQRPDIMNAVMPLACLPTQTFVLIPASESLAEQIDRPFRCSYP